MPKLVKELKDIDVRRKTHRVSTSGKASVAFHSVGGVSGLQLRCAPPKGSNKRGPRSWILRVSVGGKRRDIGLGGYPAISLSQARQLARETKQQIAQGVDPIAFKREQKSELLVRRMREKTFASVAESWLAIKRTEWATAAQVNRARQYFNDYAFPYIGSLLIQEIQRGHLVDMLEPIWRTKNPTAQRLIGYVEGVISKGIIELGLLGKMTNPAVWRGNLELSFPKASKVHKVVHQKSLEWRLLPQFAEQLQAVDRPNQPRPDAMCLLFAILCVSRPAAARLMEWDEINLETKIWTIPPSSEEKPSRKTFVEWKIPLSIEAIRILKSQPSYFEQKGRVFSTISGGEIPDNYLSGLPKSFGFDATAHGFRSTFKEWCRERGVQEEISELSMQHRDETGSRAAYARDQLLDARRKVINQYGKWVYSKARSKGKT
ncbi:integrase arm-type DNA-binding domain-containing protein [Gammaproteobacteria bacterium]|nr:integrase arm-type DNA-binding domain-containing protein [Gammaproteobacteria bacterium]